MLIYGFLRCRNEVLSGNLGQCIRGLQAVCDRVLVCDDGSVDGSPEVATALGADVVVRHDGPCIARENDCRQEFMDHVHALVAQDELAKPDWLLWMDADEVLDRQAADGTIASLGYPSVTLRDWIAARPDTCGAASFPQVQLVLSPAWMLPVHESCIRLWRYTPDLAFAKHVGPHGRRAPKAACHGIQDAPFLVLHYARAGLQRCVLKRGLYQPWRQPGKPDGYTTWHEQQFYTTDRGWFPPWAEWWDGGAPPTDGLPPAQRALAESLGVVGRERVPVAVELATESTAAGYVRNACALIAAQSFARWIALVYTRGGAALDEARAAARTDPRVFPVDLPAGVPTPTRLAAHLADRRVTYYRMSMLDPRHLERLLAA